MASVLDINLLRLFDFYLAVMLLFGFLLGRWGRLLSRLHSHRRHVLNWPTLRPLALALLLLAAQWIASRILFPQAAITLRELADPWKRAKLVNVKPAQEITGIQLELPAATGSN